MTNREYGDWPGWCVSAGWYEDKGCWFASVSRFDGSDETDWWSSDYDPPHDTPEAIERWLLSLAQYFNNPAFIPPPNFIEDLKGDEGVVGPNVTVHYDPTGQRYYRSSRRT